MSKSLLETIREISPNAGTTSKAVVARRQSHTIEEARANAVEKIESSIAYVENGLATQDGKKISLVFARDRDGTYQVGAKYGNSWLTSLVRNDKRVNKIAQADLVSTLTAIAKHVKGGGADEGLLEIQANNANRKQRKAA